MRAGVHAHPRQALAKLVDVHSPVLVGVQLLEEAGPAQVALWIGPRGGPGPFPAPHGVLLAWASLIARAGLRREQQVHACRCAARAAAAVAHPGPGSIAPASLARSQSGSPL